jgi:uncharacterized membrane protein
MLKKVSLQTESVSKASMLRRAITSEKIIPLLIFIPLCLLIGAINPTFFTWKTWQNIMMQVSNVGIIAFGAMFVITSGGLDFTAGEGVSLAGVFAATVFVASKMDNTATILAGLAMGAIMGAVNGLLIIKMKIQPFIATLSVMTIIKGFLLFLSEGVIIHFDVKRGEIEYYLAPAAMWKDFSNLTINLYLDKDMPVVTSSNLKFEKVATRTYQYISDKLPKDNLKIVIDENWWQNIISSLRSPYLPMTLMMFSPFILIALAVGIFTVWRLRKKIKHKS